MEIKVNDYVRTDNGIIGKYKVNKNWINVIETNNKDIGIDIEKDIVKHSKNIIDLIEERRLCEWKKDRYNYRFWN